MPRHKLPPLYRHLPRKRHRYNKTENYNEISHGGINSHPFSNFSHFLLSTKNNKTLLYAIRELFLAQFSFFITIALLSEAKRSPSSRDGTRGVKLKVEHAPESHLGSHILRTTIRSVLPRRDSGVTARNIALMQFLFQGVPLQVPHRIFSEALPRLRRGFRGWRARNSLKVWLQEWYLHMESPRK